VVVELVPPPPASDVADEAALVVVLDAADDDDERLPPQAVSRQATISGSNRDRRGMVRLLVRTGVDGRRQRPRECRWHDFRQVRLSRPIWRGRLLPGLAT
jgi:hypothetical protein